MSAAAWADIGGISPKPLQLLPDVAPPAAPESDQLPKSDPLVSIRQSEYLALLKLAAKARLSDSLTLRDEIDTLLRIWGER